MCNNKYPFCLQRYSFTIRKPNLLTIYFKIHSKYAKKYSKTD